MRLGPTATGTKRGMDESEKRPLANQDRVREALGAPGERPDSHVTPREDNPGQQREARDRLDGDEEEDGED